MSKRSVLPSMCQNQNISLIDKQKQTEFLRIKMYANRHRLKELKQQDLKVNVVNTKNYEAYSNEFGKINRNSENKVLTRRLLDEKKEQEIEQALHNAHELARKRAELQRIEEEKILEERERRRILYNEEKYRQQIRENNQELRELESKLRTAYVSKALAAQKAERQALALVEKLEAKKENEEMEQKRQKELEEIRQEKELNRQKKKQLREDLQNQIITTHQRNQLLYEEFLREKFYLDEIVKRIQEELLQEIQKKIEMREKTKKEMKEFQEIKKVWARKQEIEIQEENVRIKEYWQENDRKIQMEENRRKELERNREDLNEKMVTELSELEKKKLEREDLLTELYAFEMSEREEEKIQKSIEEQFRKRIETRLALEQQILDQHKRKQQEVQDEKEFKEEQMRLMADRDRIDQMSNEKRRLKLIEHRKQILELLEERKSRRAQEIAESIRLEELQQQEERRKQEIIEEERIKMLKEHAQNLIGFLPPGILRESDRQNLSIEPSKLSK